MGELLERDAPAWSQFIRDFDGAHRAFNENRAGLRAQLPYLQQKHPELLPQAQTLLARSDALASKLASLAATRASVAGWLGSLGRAYQTAIDYTSRAMESAADAWAAARKRLGLGDLGIAPVIVVVGLAAASATLISVTKWISEAFVMAKRVNTLRDLEAQGYSAGEAADVVNKTMGKPNEPGGLERTLTTIAWVVAIGIIAAAVLPGLLGNRNRSS